MGVDIELDSHVLVHLEVKLLDAIFAKDAEDAALGILSRNLNHIILRHPRVASTGRYATRRWQYCNNSTC